MFTGLVESMGSVTVLRRAAQGAVLRIAHELEGSPPEVGESIAVDGVCLTVTRRETGWFEADLSRETLDRTTLGSLRRGRRVNLERALAVGQRLGGHIVQGHVEATGVWEASRPVGDGYEARIRVPGTVSRYLLPKGSVAVDGVSLTVARLEGEVFEVALIPHTWKATNLSDRRPGDRVNLESDMVVRAVVETLERLAGPGSWTTAIRGRGGDAGEST